MDAGLITEAQLHRALTAQLVFGGHLGTSLLELGYLDERSLGETLSSMFSVPYADFDALSRVPYSVVRCLPVKLIEKYKVVPLRLEARTLHLAMIDPKNLIALDEISFVTGYRIVAHVSPEVRILQVLDKYYNLPRTQRFTTLARELSRLRSTREKLRPLESDAALLEDDTRPRRSASRVAAAVGVAATAAPAASAGRAAAGAVQEPPVDHWEKYGYGRSWREVADAIDHGSGAEPGPEGAQDAEEADTRPHALASKRPGLPSLPEVSRSLAAAESVEEIVSIALSYAASRLPRSLFFVVKSGTAVGWAGRGQGISERAVAGMALPVGQGSESLLSVVAADRGYYLGPAPRTRAAAGFYAGLGIGHPRTILVVPIAVKGRVTAYLYADGGDQEILAIDLPSILAVCARAGFALQIIILRNKILAS